MTTRKTDWMSYAMLFCTIAFWAGNAIVGRAIRADIDPVTLAALRWTGATFVILPFAWKGLREDLPVLRAAWKPVLVLCVAGVVGFNTLLYAGLQYTRATNALLVQAMIPGLVLLAGFVAFRQSEPRQKVVGIAISVLGALFTIFHGSIDAALSLRLGKGDLLVLVACCLWAVYTVLLRLVPNVRQTSFLVVTFAGAALILTPLSFLLPGRHVAWTHEAMLGVAYVSVLPSVGAYFLFNAAVARAGPAIAGQAIALIPIVGAVLAALLLSEPLHWYHAVGMAAVVAGVVIAARSGAKGQKA